MGKGVDNLIFDKIKMEISKIFFFKYKIVN